MAFKLNLKKTFILIIVDIYRMVLVLLHQGKATDHITIAGNRILASPSGIDVEGTTFLLSNAVLTDGVVFAYSAFFRNNNYVTLQIWRPVNTGDEFNGGKTFVLLSQLRIRPAVSEAREDVYIESRLVERCVRVRQGDRLGLFFDTSPGAVAYYFNPRSPSVFVHTSSQATNNTSQSQPYRIGDKITFDDLVFPYAFSLAAFIDTSLERYSSPTTFPACVKGVVIPDLYGNYETENVIVASAGIVGATGPQGPPGPQGPLGPPGPPAPSGNEHFTNITADLTERLVREYLKNFTRREKQEDNANVVDEIAAALYIPWLVLITLGLCIILLYICCKKNARQVSHEEQNANYFDINSFLKSQTMNTLRRSSFQPVFSMFEPLKEELEKEYTNTQISEIGDKTHNLSNSSFNEYDTLQGTYATHLDSTNDVMYKSRSEGSHLDSNDNIGYVNGHSDLRDAHFQIYTSDMYLH